MKICLYEEEVIKESKKGNMLGEGQEKDEIKSERLGKYKGKTRHGKFFDSG